MTPVVHTGEVIPVGERSLVTSQVDGMSIEPHATSTSVMSVSAATSAASTNTVPARSTGLKVGNLGTTNATNVGPLRLAVLSNHAGGVNIVRWSPAGDTVRNTHLK